VVLNSVLFALATRVRDTNHANTRTNMRNAKSISDREDGTRILTL